MADPDTPLGKGGHLYLIDGSAYIFRAYHALPPLTRKSDGLPVGAVSGFCNMLFKMVQGFGTKGPTHLAVIFDHSSESFRNEIYDQYKANRPPPPEDLRPQFPLIRDATRAFGLPCIEMEGFEADDLIATYAVQAREAGAAGDHRESSDKDLMQLVGGGVGMLDPMKNAEIGVEEVEAKFGVGPDRVIDVQALAGDSVDNVPGAPGIGVKTAAHADRRIWRSRHAAGPGRGDQAAQAPPDPDRARRPDPVVARSGDAEDGCAGRGGSGSVWAGSPGARAPVGVPGRDGVPDPDQPDCRGIGGRGARGRG